jgi:hypothetical protein
MRYEKTYLIIAFNATCIQLYYTYGLVVDITMTSSSEGAKASY